MSGVNSSLARDMALLGESSKLERSLDITVKISSCEALNVVVNDLMGKYKFCVKRNDQESADAFKTVLHYYLGEKDFELLLAKKDD